MYISRDKNINDDKTTSIAGTKNDPTIADTVIPKAGISAIFVIAIAAALVVAVVMYKKNQHLKDIK